MRIEQQPLRSTLEHVALPPRKPASRRPPLLLMLHGRGSDEHDLIPVTHYLDARFYIVSVRAPMRFAYGGYTWYEFLEPGLPDPANFKNALDLLQQFVIDARAHYPVDPGPFYFFGFSLGAMTALTYTLLFPENVRAVAAHSGYLPDEVHKPYRWDRLGTVSIHMSHGEQDPVVPVERARTSYELLSRSPASVTYREYPIRHQVSEQSIADIDLWFRALLGPAPTR